MTSKTFIVMWFLRFEVIIVLSWSINVNQQRQCFISMHESMWLVFELHLDPSKQGSRRFIRLWKNLNESTTTIASLVCEELSFALAYLVLHSKPKGAGGKSVLSIAELSCCSHRAWLGQVDEGCAVFCVAFCKEEWARFVENVNSVLNARISLGGLDLFTRLGFALCYSVVAHSRSFSRSVILY